MTPVVTVDARAITSTGLGTYLDELLSGLASIDHEFRFRVLCANSESVPASARSSDAVPGGLSSPPRGGGIKSPHSAGRFEFVRVTAPIYGLREQWEVARLAQATDLLHCPHYNIPYFYRGRMVVTIHDLTHLADRNYVPNWLACRYAQFMLRAAARHARQVITVSRFSKQCISKTLGVPNEKVHVISYAVPRRIREAGPADMSLIEKLRIRRPYLLFVGLLKPHKNVQALIRAFALLPEVVRNSHQLVITGKFDACYPVLCQLAEKLALGDKVVFTGHVADDELHALYAGARVFVLPSLNEGYGLPVLEAMAYGVPVIVSNISSLPEVAGDAGVLVDPRDGQSIAKALQQLLIDENLRKSLGERGRERAYSFSAREFTVKHLEVYRAALK